MSTNGRAAANRSLPKTAEELLRSLVGVADARVHLAPDGSLDFIHIVADTNAPPPQLANDVSSALIAAFGVAVGVERIRVGGEGGADGRTRKGAGVGANGAVGRSEISAEEESFVAPRQNGTKFPTGEESLRFSPGSRLASEEIAELARATAFISAACRYETARLLCRVVIRYGNSIFEGVASGPAGLGGFHELIARATVDAAKNAKISSYPIEFDSVALASLGTNTCVVVAIRVWHETLTVLGSGSAIIQEDAAQAVADAVLMAISDMLACGAAGAAP